MLYNVLVYLINIDPGTLRETIYNISFFFPLKNLQTFTGASLNKAK